jgi:hypothetical protein
LAQLHGIERILHALIDRDVARNDRDCLDSHTRILQRHHKCDRIIGGSVRINEKMTGHTLLQQLNQKIVIWA